ncbi:IucC family-domain-containing protein [Aspergillus alliaceus]|uniref:IucC family-domain-containing protein n=1 Tax=Petromyces alliaceus TaxID=209559 RepID=A0A5N7BWF3_PETAA|nr:IucC family-domain-containing protein [Aspergillus alliaceus]
MTVLSRYDQACFETTRRLLAEIINEGLATARVAITDSTRQLVITSNSEHLRKTPERWVKIGLLQGAYIGLKDGKVVSLVRPENLTPPPMVFDDCTERPVLDPEVIFSFMRPWFLDEADDSLLREIGKELKNSSNNQALVFGHPCHPYHRLCYAQAPLEPHGPEDIPGMLTPSLAFVSVPRTDMRISRSFEATLDPLLTRLGVPRASGDRIIVPCLINQLPAVRLYFPSAVLVKTVCQCVDAQASMRTLTVRQELDFPYHLKVSLACYITSALRTITPWTTINGPVFTELLERFLPPDLWVFGEVASVTGSQSDFNKAKHLSCILRHDLEAKARMNNETLILAAALSHPSPETGHPYAETLFKLQTSREKESWFRRYIACLFKLALPPLLNHGIGLELHGQNLIVRVCLQTGEIKGFAVRDFGGIRLHTPTLRQYGVKFESLLMGSATITDSLHNVWSKVHHSMLQNHVGSLMAALGLECKGGWAVVREELLAVLRPDDSATGQSLYQFFLGDTMPFKCFLRMRMEGKYRDYVERELPNVALMGLPRWEDVLTDYQPLLHRT